MDKKVILISVDGMRPDGLSKCGNEFLSELKARCAYSFSVRSVFPSVTLPCHFSMTHSVTPQRHGILSNQYIPQVRPVDGIFERVKSAGGVCAFFYGWDTLRDIALPGSVKFATYVNAYMMESVDTYLTSEAIRVIGEHKPDFAFLYMVDTDDKGGHDSGWMTEEYFRRISIAIDNVRRVVEAFSDEYTIIITADHGGHDRTHGTDMPEDMTVPIFLLGRDFAAGEIDAPVSILDVAPTIAEVMGIPFSPEWEGKAILSKK